MKSTAIWILMGLFVAGSAFGETPPRAEPPKAVLTLEDQFEKKQDISQFRGDVVVILYGDREGMPANRGLGEKLHVHYHPTAKGSPPAQANKAPVVALPGVREGVRSPDVRVLPIACIGKVPEVVKNLIRARVKKESPETLVLLDFEGKMQSQFGMKEGMSNLVVLDALGRVRLRSTGELDAAKFTKLTQAIDSLRQEAADSNK
ncbi:MAG: hypothetical protein K8T89_08525 [Planctomycetes bacterium]|nr:hypothetical protein [Planctomycetota bacterium]